MREEEPMKPVPATVRSVLKDIDSIEKSAPPHPQIQINPPFEDRSNAESNPESEQQPQ